MSEIGVELILRWWDEDRWAVLPVEPLSTMRCPGKAESLPTSSEVSPGLELNFGSVWIDRRVSSSSLWVLVSLLSLLSLLVVVVVVWVTAT